MHLFRSNDLMGGWRKETFKFLMNIIQEESFNQRVREKSVWWRCFCTGRTQEVFLSLAFVIAKGENVKRESEEKKYIYTYNNKCL